MEITKVYIPYIHCGLPAKAEGLSTKWCQPRHTTSLFIQNSVLVILTMATSQHTQFSVSLSILDFQTAS